jgi:DNA-binding CsgD family transcriptional regulator
LADPPSSVSNGSADQIRVLVILPQSAQGLARTEALAERPEIRAGFAKSLAAVREDALARHEFLLVPAEVLSWPVLPRLVRLSRITPIVLMVDRESFLKCASYFPFVTAPLFMDTPLDSQIAALRLARSGFMLVPPYIGASFAMDRLRLRALARLQPQELAILDALREGLSNPAIAARLGTSEQSVKGRVRAVLTKLQVNNRTEAALFATRWWHYVDAARHSRGGGDEDRPDAGAGDGHNADDGHNANDGPNADDGTPSNG